jgi:hypothetical protein
MEILAHVTGPVEICDAEGKVLGHFTPANQECAKTTKPRTLEPADLERRKAPGRKSFTTREVFEHLKAVTTDREMQDYLQQKINDLAKRDECVAP